MLLQLRRVLVVCALVTLMVSVQKVIPHQDMLTFVTKELQYGEKAIGVREKEEFQEKKYKHVLSELKRSSLKPADSELLAKALSKLYAGVPLCTYTYSDEVTGELFEENSEVGKWTVVPSGTHRFRSELPVARELRKPLNTSMSPFIYVPGIPFRVTEGAILNETDTLVTFSFPLDHQLFEQTHPRIRSWIRFLIQHTDWRVKVSVDKEQQTPHMIKIGLAEPVRKRMRYNFDKFEISMKFAGTEDCECHALTSLSIRIEGWVFSLGKVEEEKTDTYSNIVCDRPLVYLLPHTPRVRFLDHISYRVN